MKSKLIPNRIYLTEREIPKKWYNIAADLKTKLLPPLDPQTNQPIGPDKLSAIFPHSLIEQEVSQKQFIKIPEDVLKVYLKWRPTPLVRARGLEELLETPAHIYYKNESVSPAGSHKPNTAIAQAYYNKLEGVKRLSTETGAGQWGSALSMACNYFQLGCKVFMVKSSYDQKPYRRIMMQVWGAEVTRQPERGDKVRKRAIRKIS